MLLHAAASQSVRRRVSPPTVVVNPSLGGYNSAYDIHTVGVNPKTTPTFTTQGDGSGLYVFAACDLNEFGTSGVSHNKTGAVSHVGSLQYTFWAPYGARMFRVQSLQGGTGQTVSMTVGAGAATAEKTIMAVEVMNGRTLQDWNAQELPASAAASVTGPSVTTTGAAVLLSAWWGDANVSNPMSADLSAAALADGWQKLIEITVESQAHIQAALAARVVSGAGTYSCEWNHVPNQRALMFAAAVQA